MPRPPTLDCADVRALLRRAHFEHKNTTGSHEQWEGYVDGKRQVVTLDKNDEPFTSRSRSLRSMIRQSGLGKRRWYALHAGEPVDLGNPRREPA